MIISEKQILNLMAALHESRKIINVVSVAHPGIGENFLKLSAELLNEINRQQSEELKEIIL